LLKKVIKRCL